MDLGLPGKSQKFAQYDHLLQIEPLLLGEHHLQPLLERAHDLQRAAQSLAGVGAPAELRQLLRAMNSYYSNKIEGQHTLPFEIENALRSVYAQEPDKARRQRLALAHMQTERAIEAGWKGWTSGQVWSVQMVRDIHQDLFARLPDVDRVLPEGDVLLPGALRDRDVSVGVHAAPAHAAIGAMLDRWGAFYGGVGSG